MKHENETEEEEASLWLPLEVWQEILQRLKPNDLLRCSVLCRAWQSAELVNRSFYRLNRDDTRRLSPQRLSSMRNLVSLSLYDMRDRYNDALKSLVNLTHLDVIATQYMTDQYLRPLTKLVKLGIGKSIVTINTLLALPSLTAFKLTSLNRSLGDSELSKLTQLRSLYVEGYTRIRGKGIATLTQLTKLKLDDEDEWFYDVTDAIIMRLSNLTKLSIGSTKITDHGIVCLTKLRTLKLYIEPITNQAIEKLSLLTCLQVSDLSPIVEERLNPAIRFLRTDDMMKVPVYRIKQ